MRIPRLIAVLLLLVSPALAGEITVAAAADLSAPIQEIAAGFEKQTGNKVRLSLGSSGNFFAQIQSGAPFDVFLSADSLYPKKLEEDGLAIAGTERTYAIGRLVLWVPAASKLDLSKGLYALLNPDIHRIAIANPRHAPYGAAAVQMMKWHDMYERLRPKIVEGENVSQAAQFVQSGNADIGIIAKSLALSPSMKSSGRFADLPSETDQSAVILRSTTEAPIANAFLNYLTGPAGREVLERYGFSLPELKK